MILKPSDLPNDVLPLLSALNVHLLLSQGHFAIEEDHQSMARLCLVLVGKEGKILKRFFDTPASMQLVDRLTDFVQGFKLGFDMAIPQDPDLT